MFAATEDVWVVWFRTPDGTYNILSAGPTREECMAVLYKLLPGAAPGESWTRVGRRESEHRRCGDPTP